MVFNSIEFFVFAAIVFPLFYLLRGMGRSFLLLVSSYFFYAYWNPWYLSLIIFSTLVDYFSAIQITKFTNRSKKRFWLCTSLVSNIGLLSFFKYYNFFASSVSENLPLHDFLLPVGISFYTFQTMSYTIDVFNEKTKAEKNIVKFALYVVYFPQLVAGPIERSWHLMPQLSFLKKIEINKFKEGGYLFLMGLVKKVVVADNLAFIVDPVFKNPEAFGGSSYFFATCFFALQIYADFSGYSEMAIGLSKMLGIDLIKNFNRPYLAKSIQEFWTRWHISLSQWFRDYLYIPLGGGRGSKVKVMLNTLIVFLVSGLWHGANWTFVAWGGIHGVALVLSRSLSKVTFIKCFKDRNDLLFSIGGFAATQLTVILAWVYFRADTISSANLILLGIFKDIDSLSIQSYHESLVAQGVYDWFVVRAIFFGFALYAFQLFTMFPSVKKLEDNILDEKFWALRAFIVSVAFFLILFYGNSDAQEFIYFQF